MAPGWGEKSRAIHSYTVATSGPRYVTAMKPQIEYEVKRSWQAVDSERSDGQSFFLAPITGMIE